MMPCKNAHMGRLHIVYELAYPFIKGGGQKRLFEVGRRLAERGWSVYWYTFKTWDGEDSVKKDGITYIGLPGFVPLYAPDGRRTRAEAVAFGRAVWARRREIRGAAVLWCGQWPYFHILPLLFRTHGRLFIDWWETWGSHWFEYSGWSIGAAGFALERMLASICSRRGTIVAISTKGVRDLEKLWVNAASVIEIPNGIDLSRIGSAPQSDDKVDIVYFGRLQSHKNIDHILYALKLLKVKYGLTLSADIIGAGPEEKFLRELSERLELEHQLRFLGELGDQEMYSRVKAATVFVHPTTKDGGGSITLFESQACGTPVIIYDCRHGVDVSYVSQGTTGWILDRVGPDILASHIARLVAANEFCSESMRRCCRDAITSYDWDKIAERYDKLFLSRPTQTTVKI